MPALVSIGQLLVSELPVTAGPVADKQSRRPSKKSKSKARCVTETTHTHSGADSSLDASSDADYDEVKVTWHDEATDENSSNSKFALQFPTSLAAPCVNDAGSNDGSDKGSIVTLRFSRFYKVGASTDTDPVMGEADLLLDSCRTWARAKIPTEPPVYLLTELG